MAATNKTMAAEIQTRKEQETGAGNPISKTGADVTFDIQQIPFFRAVELFENEKYQEAFPLFLECAKELNLFAIHYLQYLVNPAGRKLIQPLSAAQEVDVKQVLEFIHLMPSQFHPEYWCKASLLLISLRTAIKAKENSKLKKIVSDLLFLTPYAANACIGLIKAYWEIKDKSKAITVATLKACSKQMVEKTDLLSIDFLCRTNPSATVKKEWAAILQIAKNYLKGRGNIERAISKLYHNKSLGDNIERHLNWMTHAAHMGNLEAQAHMYQISIINKILVSESEKWLLVTALNHAPGPLIELGLCFYYGNATWDKNLVKARMFLQEGLTAKPQELTVDVQQLVRPCRLLLGKMFELGEGGAQDFTTAIKYYQGTLTRNDPEGYWKLGDCYSHKENPQKNYRLALEYYKRASDVFARLASTEQTRKAISDIHQTMAKLYREGGFSIQPDLSLALKYYKEASKQSVYSLFTYASMLYLGEGCVADKPEAIALIVQAANQGYASAALNVARLYLSKLIVNSQELNLTDDRILQYLLLANNTIKETASALAVYYFNKGSYREAYPYILKGVELRQLEAIVCLGNLYETGCEELKLNKDEKIALDYYQQSSDLGDPLAMTYKGNILLYGKAGLRKNELEAKKLFEESFKQGNKLAAYYLWLMYYNGYGVQPDLKKAVEYLKLAEATEDLDVLWDLAHVYDRGQGVAENKFLATQYAFRAAEAGHAAASLQCAWAILKNTA